MKNFKQDIERKVKLTPQQINCCMLHIVRDPDLFDYARQHLKPTDFNPLSEGKYAVFWASVLDVAARNDNKLPTQGLELILAVEITSKCDNSPQGELSESTKRGAIDLLAWINLIQDSDLNPTYYKPLIQELIIERTVFNEIARDMTLSQTIGRPVDILKSFENYRQKIQTVLVDNNEAGQSAFPDNYKPKKLGKYSTGENFLDNYMNGGQASGEVYVVLGPTGLGKTTLGVMIANSTAKVWNAAYEAKAIERPKMSCFFSWEQDLERLRHRFWANAAQIDSSRLELYADEAIELSSYTTKLEDYELEEFKSLFEKGIPASEIGGERERLARASAALRDSVKIYDFSGAAENPRAGEGGLDEVAAVLRALNKEGKDVGVVVIDYANAAVRRMLSAKGIDLSNMRHYLANFCNECRFKIAIPFNCSVWVLNQLNTESNRRAPTAAQHHSYASECGNFAENAWFAFAFSTKDKETNTCVLYCTKERRSKGDRPPVVLKIEGNFCRMRDVSNEYILDTVSKRIVSTDMANRRVDPTTVQRMRDQQERRRPGSSGLGSM